MTLPETNAASPPRITLIVTSGLSLGLLRGQLEHLAASGYRVTFIAGDRPPEEWNRALEALGPEGFELVPMRRTIAPFADLVSLFRLWRVLCRLKPEILNASTPKAGLLGGLAGFLAGVPCRLYVLRGLRFETARGAVRELLRWMERLSCSLAHRVLAVSPSLRQSAIETGVARPGKIEVLAHGSSNGVDTERFLPGQPDEAGRAQLRRRFNLPADAPVVGFVGRLTRDKGVRELTAAFASLREQFPEARLLVVGDFEQGDAVDQATRQQILDEERIVRTGFQADTAPFYALMDLLVLPTYREGFPNVVLEAQASGVPVVTTRATGAVDSIEDGATGLLVPVGDVDALAGAMARLLASPEQSRQMGLQGRERVERLFRQQMVWEAMQFEYRRLRANRQRGWRLLLKRALDLAAVTPVMIVFAPAMALLWLVVLVLHGRPVLFNQVRPGKNGQIFRIRKFRTMNQKTSPDGKLLPDEQRLTRFGRLMRSTSLDELPQLWNVFWGEMSLVGPRPLLIEYLERYTSEQARRHDVLPGITGWSQINGRNAIEWDQKLALDTWYVDHWSLMLDLRILLGTVFKVVRRDGVSQKGCATMPEFLGTESRQEAGR